MLYPMDLFKIKRIRYHAARHHVIPWYDVHFENGKCLAATHLHAFVTIRADKTFFIPTDCLAVGDWIWVDTSAFVADGSLYRKRKTR